METVNGQLIVFQFFLLSFAGWVLESIQESIVRGKLVNKGFFRGPFALSHAIGGLCVYAAGSPLRARPALVFLAGLVLCTIVEYVMAIFLEKCFHVKCWDYRTYPHTRFCHFQGRICLTISLFFGFITLFVVYLYWDFGRRLAALLGPYLLLVDGFCCGAFAFDAVTRCAELLKAKKAGRKVTGFAVFSVDGPLSETGDAGGGGGKKC